MKKVSISTITLNKMTYGEQIFHTVAEAEKVITKCGVYGENAHVIEVYEMGDVNKKIEYNVFRGYIIEW